MSSIYTLQWHSTTSDAEDMFDPCDVIGVMREIDIDRLVDVVTVYLQDDLTIDLSSVKVELVDCGRTKYFYVSCARRFDADENPTTIHRFTLNEVPCLDETELVVDMED
jgi:hypothetical protein